MAKLSNHVADMGYAYAEVEPHLTQDYANLTVDITSVIPYKEIYVRKVTISWK